jgi:O-antigen/teichoic acid export membrane protein
MLNKISHYALATFYNAFLGIFSIFILTKYYDFSDFGKIALFILVGNVAGNLLTFGLGKATQRFYFESLKNNDFDNFKILNYSNLISILIIFIIFCPIIYFFANDLKSYFKINEDINFFFISYIYGFFNITYFYFLNLIISQKKSKTYLYFAVCYSTSNIILTILLIFFYNDNFLSRIYSLLVINIFFSVVIGYYNLSNLKFNWSNNEVVKSFKFSLPGYPSTLMGVVHSNFDKTFLATVQNITSLGILDISNKIGLISKMFIDFIIQAWIPEFMTNANENNRSKIVLNYKQIVFYFGIFILGLSFFCEELLWILTSKSFYIAKYYVPLICLSVFVNHMFTLVATPAISYAKQLQKNFLPSLLSLFLNVSLNIILIPIYGVLGVIISMVISGLFSGCLSFYYGQKCFKLEIGFFFIFQKILILSFFVSMVYLLYFVDLNMYINFMIKIALFLAFIMATYKKEYFDIEYLKKIKFYK